MFKKFKKQINNEKGLTLIELLAVIVILAIVAAIAVPAIGNIIQNSKEKAVVSDALMVLSAANLYFVDNPEATEVKFEDVTVDSVVVPGLVPQYLDDAGTLTLVTVTKGTGDTPTQITFTGTAGSKVNKYSNKSKADLTSDTFNFDDSVDDL